MAIAIHVESLGKRYRIGERLRYLTLRDRMAWALRAPVRMLRRDRSSESNGGPSEIWALRNTSFQVQEGEVIGLIGRNGAGKTTLLKVLSRVTLPTTGWAEIRGRVGSLLEVGTGFHPELTGRENVFLNGAILGMGRREITAKFDEIVAFGEVEEFIDTPIKHYSTGMQMRLAFSVAAHFEPQILLVDEVLAVGDLAFQKKCLGKMDQVAQTGRTILFVSHQMSQIRRLCSRCIWIDQGQVQGDGPTAEVIGAYEAAIADRARQAYTQGIQGNGAHRINFVSWELVDEISESPHLLKHQGPVTVKVIVSLSDKIAKGTYGILLTDDSGRTIWHENREIANLPSGVYEFVHRMPMLPLRPASYHWKTAIYDGHRWSDPWVAFPPLAVGTEPLTNATDGFASVLNVPCEFEIRPACLQEVG